MGELHRNCEDLPLLFSADSSVLVLLFLVGGLEGALTLSLKTFGLRLSGAWMANAGVGRCVSLLVLLHHIMPWKMAVHI